MKAVLSSIFVPWIQANKIVDKEKNKFLGSFDLNAKTHSLEWVFYVGNFVLQKWKSSALTPCTSHRTVL